MDTNLVRGWCAHNDKRSSKRNSQWNTRGKISVRMARIWADTNQENLDNPALKDVNQNAKYQNILRAVRVFPPD